MSFYSLNIQVNVRVDMDGNEHCSVVIVGPDGKVQSFPESPEVWGAIKQASYNGRDALARFVTEEKESLKRNQQHREELEALKNELLKKFIKPC
jgi:cell shape-determining protein MreC